MHPGLSKRMQRVHQECRCKRQGAHLETAVWVPVIPPWTHQAVRDAGTGPGLRQGHSLHISQEEEGLLPSRGPRAGFIVTAGWQAWKAAMTLDTEVWDLMETQAYRMQLGHHGESLNIADGEPRVWVPALLWKPCSAGPAAKHWSILFCLFLYNLNFEVC